jgi:hypothetical protein
MGLEVAGSAAIGKQPDAVAHVRGVAHGMLDRELRRQADDIHALDRKFAEPPLQAGSPEGAVAVAGDEDFSTTGLETIERRGSPGAALERAKGPTSASSCREAP